MSAVIYVINPNSSTAVTAGIDAAMEPLRIAGGPVIECLTLASGPLGIQTQCDVDSVVMPLLALARSVEDRAAAFVIACFSDPGLHALREATRRPVFGISESAALTAMSLGQTFGVIAILETSIPRHLRAWGSMGIRDRLAGEVAIGLNVADLSEAKSTLDRMIVAGRRLRDEHGAHVLVMGCAGMAGFRDALQEAVGLPVVEPSQAAVAMAVGRVLLGWERAGRG
jgi:Asp/Glu/hydantoin racemase